jgi:hypothetical protein
MRFAGQPLQASSPPPLLGENSLEILKNVLGLSESRLSDLVGRSAALQTKQS